eukprot:11919285-Alexandrium_andersonii.AAC.1
MPGGLPEAPPGLDPGLPRQKRSRFAGAAPTGRPSSTTPSASSSPTTFGPPGAVGDSRRAPG